MRYDVELLRIIAAFGIVWFHSGYSLGREIAYSGLVVFLVFSAYFATKSASKYSIAQRASRLLLPCLIWSVIYGGLKYLNGSSIFPDHSGFLRALLITPSIHLWYLPFIFFCVVLIDWGKLVLSHNAMAILAVLSSALLLLSSSVWREFDVASPLAQYLHALPAIFWGIFLGQNHLLADKLRLALIIPFFIVLLIVFAMGISGVSVTYSLGILLTSILLMNKSYITEHAFIAELSKLTLGIYLSHVALLFAFRQLGLTNALLPIVSFFVSALLVFLGYKFLPPKLAKYLF